jgi:hypothetical protein
MLAPTWRLGDIVIMDNLAAHKVAGVLQAVEACGAELRYLPPYSPDFNPIENAFAKFKAHVRKSHALTRRCDGRAFARFLLRSLAACGRILAALRGWAADIERRTDAQIVGAVKDLGQGYQECRRVAERRSRGNCPAQDPAGTPILLSKSWRRRSKQRQTMALAGNCAAPFTLARFARVGTSHRRAECSSDSPPKNLGRRPKMWSRGVGN